MPRKREEIEVLIAYHKGYIDACCDYAVNKNGELILGCGVYKFKDVMKKKKEKVRQLEEELRGCKSLGAKGLGRGGDRYNSLRG